MVSAAEAALARQRYVSAIDVLMGIGWLAPAHVQRWRTGQIAYLEATIQTNLSRISEAMQLFRAWASRNGLRASETAYVARTPTRSALRFSKSGDPAIEQAYRTHWISPELSERKRQKLKEKVSRAPELVVIRPLGDWTCHRCGGSGDLLIMEQPGPACLGCGGLGELEFLPAGDAALTRRAKAMSRVHAVVVRFSRTRGRYERQGLLVEDEALRAAELELRGGPAMKPPKAR